VVLCEWFRFAVVAVLDVVGVKKGERERGVGGPEEVVMDANSKEDRTADKKDGQPPI